MTDNLFEEKLSFLRKVFGAVHVPAGRGDPAVSCPKCRNPEKKKLAIQIANDLCNCWVCGLHGRLVTVLMQFKPSYVHEYMTKFAGRSVDISAFEPIIERPNLPDGFRLLVTAPSSDTQARWALNYVLGRGLGRRDLWYFKFGVSSDPTYIRRVIMPSFDSTGALNFFTARAIDNLTYRKYMNCVAEKKSIIFNEINIDWTSELTLVEGPFDLVKCDENATCLLGSSLTEDSALFYQIFKNRTPIVLALDSDMHDKSWQRIARLLASYDIPVRILDPSPFKDVGEMTRDQFRDAKARAVGWDRDLALTKKIMSIRS